MDRLATAAFCAALGSLLAHLLAGMGGSPSFLKKAQSKGVDAPSSIDAKVGQPQLTGTGR